MMSDFIVKMDLATVRPSCNARRTLDVCFKNRMAWKIAGKKFRDQLFGTYDVELEGRITQVVIDEKDWRFFKDIVIKYDLGEL